MTLRHRRGDFEGFPIRESRESPEMGDCVVEFGGVTEGIDAEKVKDTRRRICRGFVRQLRLS